MTKQVKQLKTTVEYSEITEYQRILFVCHYLKNGFYQSKDFYLLPYQINNSRVIFLPELKIFKNSDFFADLSNKKGNIFTKPFQHKASYYQEQLLAELKEYETNSISRDIDEVIKLWNKISNKFFSLCDKFIPGLFDNYSGIIIRPTKYGSICSEFASETNSDEIKLYLREDADINHLIEGILMTPLNFAGQKKLLEDFSWEEREAIIDFLINNTSLGKLSSNDVFSDKIQLKLNKQCTLPNLRDKSYLKLSKDSRNYYEKLGFPSKIIIKLSPRTISINNEIIPFTKSEDKVFRLLFRNSNEIVTIDEIGKALWLEKSIESFSLSAITKLIQRIRDKIEKSGITPSLIETQRNRGFTLRYNR